MSYNASLSKRIESIIKGKKGFTRKEMFGGVGFMLNGNMCVGVHKDDLIIRFDPGSSEEIMVKKGTKPFDITGRPMKGWLLVEPEGTKGTQLKGWVDLALRFVKTLPKK